MAQSKAKGGEEVEEKRLSRWLVMGLVGVVAVAAFMIVASIANQSETAEDYQTFILEDPAPSTDSAQTITPEPTSTPTSMGDLKQTGENGRDSLPIE